MEFLKDVLGDELYNQVAEKLKGNDKIKLANLADGQYVDRKKFDDLEKVKNSLQTQVDDFNKVDTAGLQSANEQLKKENAALKQASAIDAELYTAGAVNVALAADESAATTAGGGLDWEDILNPVIIAAALSVVALVFDIIRKIVPVLFNWFKAKVTNAAILGALEEAEKEAETIVLSLQQTVVEGLKAKTSDGKLSVDDIKSLKDTSVKMFLQRVSDSTVKIIQEKAGDINKYISDLIERKIQEMLKLRQ